MCKIWEKVYFLCSDSDVYVYVFEKVVALSRCNFGISGSTDSISEIVCILLIMWFCWHLSCFTIINTGLQLMRTWSQMLCGCSEYGRPFIASTLCVITHFECCCDQLRHFPCISGVFHLICSSCHGHSKP